MVTNEALRFNLTYLENHPDPWVRYRTWLDLAGLPADDPRVTESRAEILRHPLIRGLLAELDSWPGVVLNSHKSAGQQYHKLAFLAEVGLTAEDGALAGVLGKIAEHLGPDRIPRLSASIPQHFGGDGQESWAWALCDAPLLLWTIRKMDPAGQIVTGTSSALGYLAGLVRANGWPCTVSKELGSFRGPGRKDDPCPYATLLMLKLLLDAHANPSGFPTDTPVAAGIGSLLGLWQASREQHPYQFYMGTDFRKLKAPFIWYDLLHVLDVLSRSAAATQDSRFADMLQLMNAKAGPDSLFTPESEWKAWNAWEFGQKKQPSAWLTFLVYRINRRVGRLSL